MPGAPVPVDPHARLRSFWNDAADWYNAAAGHVTPQLVPELLQGLDPRSGPLGPALDLACGAGRTTRALAAQLQSPGTITGLDLSPAMLDLARSEAGNESIVFVEGRAEALPFPDSSFELALCSLGLMIFPDPGLALAELARVLRPKGEFRAAVWGRPEQTTLVTLMPRVAERLGIEIDMPPRSNFHLGTADALAAAARNSGLTLVDSRYFELRFPFDSGVAACDAMGIQLESRSPRLDSIPPEALHSLVAGCQEEAEELLDAAGGALLMDILIARLVHEGKN